MDGPLLPLLPLLLLPCIEVDDVGCEVPELKDEVAPGYHERGAQR